MLLFLAPTCSVLSLFIEIKGSNFVPIFIVNMIMALIVYLLYEIMRSVKNQYKIRNTCIKLITEYEDEKVLMNTPIAYHRHFNILKELLEDN